VTYGIAVQRIWQNESGLIWHPLAAYNNRVLPAPSQNDPKQRRQAIYATETSGLIVIAFLVLVFLVVRYWHAIHWSWR
jgi:hypothetical protein